MLACLHVGGGGGGIVQELRPSKGFVANAATELQSYKGYKSKGYKANGCDTNHDTRANASAASLLCG